MRSAAVVIDLGDYHPELRDGRIWSIEQGLLDSEWVASQIERDQAVQQHLARSLAEKGTARGLARQSFVP